MNQIGTGQTKAACHCTDEMKNGESDKWEKEWVWRISLVNKRKMKKTTSNWNAMAIGSSIYSFNRHRCDRSSNNNNIQASIQVKLIGNNESTTLWAVWKEHNSNHRPTTCVCVLPMYLQQYCKRPFKWLVVQFHWGDANFYVQWTFWFLAAASNRIVSMR